MSLNRDIRRKPVFVQSGKNEKNAIALYMYIYFYAFIFSRFVSLLQLKLLLSARFYLFDSKRIETYLKSLAFCLLFVNNLGAFVCTL